MSIPFRDRRDAGRQLAQLLHACGQGGAVVLGIPCGGIPVAYEVAHQLGASLDVFLTRRLLAPAAAGTGAGLGVLGSRDARLLDRDLIYGARIPPGLVDEMTRLSRAALLAEESDYRDESPRPDLRGRTALLVDDGTAGLDTVRYSVQLLRELDVERVVLAAPTMARAQAAALARVADDVVNVVRPELHVPQRWYADFSPTTPGEVRALVQLAYVEQQARSSFAAR